MEAAPSTRRGRALIASAVALASLSGALLACGPASSQPSGAAVEVAFVEVESRLPPMPPDVSADEALAAATTASTAHPPASSTVDPSTVEPPTVEPSNDVPATVPAVLPAVDTDAPAVAGRPVPPPAEVVVPSATTPVSPWASFTSTAANGKVATDVGCAASSASALDRFLADRVGPVLGWDYQHVYPLGGDRYLWLFQDAFLDRSGAATGLGGAAFVHNAAMVQTGTCFSLQHGGSPEMPMPFEVGDGTGTERATWYWPLGGELNGDRLWVFWTKMEKDGYDPAPPDGLGWHPVGTYLASYDRTTLARMSFGPAPNSGAVPLYGFAVASDDTHSYLFGNTFEQNLVREGGYANAPHSATRTWLARVPRGQMWVAPEYRTSDGWSSDPAAAVPVQGRFAVEDPVQPRFIGGRWVAVSKVDGYWGDDMVVDTALDPWGPWITTERFRLQTRHGDTARNTYHAHLLPWLAADGTLIVSVSGNARNMLRDAWPHPERYRPMVFALPMPPAPAPPTALPEPAVTDPVVDGTTVAPEVASEPAVVTSLPPAPTTTAPTTAAPTTAAPTTAAPTTAAPTTAAPTTAAPTTAAPTTAAPTTAAPTTAAPTTAAPTTAAPTTAAPTTAAGLAP